MPTAIPPLLNRVTDDNVLPRALDEYRPADALMPRAIASCAGL
jgi:hypothetical protein